MTVSADQSIALFQPRHGATGSAQLELGHVPGGKPVFLRHDNAGDDDPLSGSIRRDLLAKQGEVDHTVFDKRARETRTVKRRGIREFYKSLGNDGVSDPAHNARPPRSDSKLLGPSYHLIEAGKEKNTHVRENSNVFRDLIGNCDTTSLFCHPQQVSA